MRTDLKEHCIAITADHSTPASVKDHSGDSVPVAICAPGARVDSVNQYDEVSVATGGLGHIRGMDLIPMLLNITNRSEKFGA